MWQIHNVEMMIHWSMLWFASLLSLFLVLIFVLVFFIYIRYILGSTQTAGRKIVYRPVTFMTALNYIPFQLKHILIFNKQQPIYYIIFSAIIHSKIAKFNKKNSILLKYLSKLWWDQNNIQYLKLKISSIK